MLNYYGDLPVVYLEGTPAERGIHHGRTLGQHINVCLKIEFEIHSIKDKEWDTVLSRVEPYRKYLEREHPVAYQELEGIARGAEVPLNAIILINESEDEFWNGSCSTVVALPNASRDGHVLLGKNRDGPYLRLKTDALFVVSPATGPRYITMAGVGTLARDGINECGIVMLGNGLGDPDVMRVQGVSFAVLRKYLLNQITIDGILTTLATLPRKSSFNYTLASEAGEALAIEATVKSLYRVNPVNGVLIHTNHFIAAGAANIPEKEVPWGARSKFRLERLRSILESKAGDLTIVDIQKALADHLEHPGSVCSHRVELGQPGGTLNSYCFDLSEKIFYIANGPPCCTPYIPIPLSDIGLDLIQCG